MSRLSSRKLSVLIAVDKVSTDGLPPGNYVLYISDSSAPPQAVKLTIKQ